MCETEKRECLRFPLPTVFAVLACMAAKLDQARFLRIASQGVVYEVGGALRG
jgi:hypothetical protein